MIERAQQYSEACQPYEPQKAQNTYADPPEVAWETSAR